MARVISPAAAITSSFEIGANPGDRVCHGSAEAVEKRPAIKSWPLHAIPLADSAPCGSPDHPDEALVGGGMNLLRARYVVQDPVQARVIEPEPAQRLQNVHQPGLQRNVSVA
ncbi:hypothetical protein AB0A81_36980 [Streptomyces flaveolus]|uniref:Uncharacterized protein n=1 Tax=Streptomyces flaveolus TaxID=67297 RepID=A0ABV1VKM3_9ACTN